MMRCMCGDLYCPSCGAAQGNYRCPYCGAWAADGGCADHDACKRADEAFCDAQIAEIQWEKDHASEIGEELHPG